MQPTLSIIIPTLNEADSLPLLLPRIADAMQGRAYEVIIVDDDSLDSTPHVCAQLAKHHPLRLLIRRSPENGLSGAVLHGMAEAAGEIFVVMDADLQHPPESLAALIEPIERNTADFAIGSRYCAGAKVDEQWSMLRRLNSIMATLLARPVAGPVRDPMSGFFSLNRATFDRARRLSPLGYKIALELLCKSQAQRIVEIPIHFGRRQRGVSKLSFKEQLRYVRHLSRLYDFFFPRSCAYVRFAAGAAAAFSSGIIALTLLLVSGVSPALATVLAYAGSIAMTSLELRGALAAAHRPVMSLRPWRDLVASSLAEATCAGAAILWLASHLIAPTPLSLFAIGFAIATGVRYVMRKEFALDLAGLVRELRREELRHFKTPNPTSKPDFHLRLAETLDDHLAA